MATVTGLTAERMQAIEAASVVDGDIVGNDLILTKHDGSTINAGNVRGPTGPVGPAGSNLPVISALPVLDVGLANQIRAGRQLLPIDFTNMGLLAPAGLWNLSDLADVSGNGRNLLNKGAVPFGVGINGIAASAAVFSGAAAQGLYIADTGVSDPFRIRSGSIGCWFRTAKRTTVQTLVAKWGKTGGTYSWTVDIMNDNTVRFLVSPDGTGSTWFTTFTDACDDRWHFVVFTYDGVNVRLYFDTVLENVTNWTNLFFPAPGPLNIGSSGVDAANTASNPMYGRIDEAFITSEVLSDDQIRNLYSAKISHALGSIPKVVNLNVRRARRGAPFVSADFPAQPVRLYNFTAGAYSDQGSAGVTLTPNPASGIIGVTVGVDGVKDGALYLSGNHQGVSSSDAGLPSGLSSRTYGCWIKTSAAMASNGHLMGWGTGVTGDARMLVSNSTGCIGFISGPDNINSNYFVIDGNWHFVVVVEDNAAGDGLKRKLYGDGVLKATSTVLTSLVLFGANKFRIGAYNDTGIEPFLGIIDGAFVYNGALTVEQIRTLYNKSSQLLPTSPKDSGSHIEAIDAGSLYTIFDQLDSMTQIDLAVAS